MSAEAPTSTVTLTDRSLLPSIQTGWPRTGSAPGASPEALDAGPVLSAYNQEVRCVMSLLVA
jgi:hypothetical protein